MSDTPTDAPDSLFTQKEIEYLKSQQLCRIATVGTNGQPHVTPVGFRFN